MLSEERRRVLIRIVTWALRLAAGAAFVVSGCAKMIDPYGFTLKIGEYLSVWHLDSIVAPGWVLFAACGISVAEFLTGFNLAVGSLRRFTVWTAAAIMAVMLPLSVYIAVANPVEHCGCFGDLWVISNAATLLKNLALTAAVAWLAIFNTREPGLYAPWSQWIQITVATAYIIVVGAAGYFEQPLLDFRQYPAGRTLVSADDGSDIVFLYEKDGVKAEFTADDLPDESEGWVYVDRIASVKEAGLAGAFAIVDDDGYDVTDEVIGATPEQLLLLIPDTRAAGISGTYVANELNEYVTSRHGGDAFVAVTGATAAERAEWLDLSMADYPLYSAETTAIRELARGKMAVVYLRGDTVMWKRNITSVNPDILASDGATLADLDPRGPERFRRYTMIFAGLELLLLIISVSASVMRKK